LISTAAAQDSKQEMLIPDTELPWGLVIQFAPDATLKQANELRLKHGLVSMPQGYLTADGRNVSYDVPADDDYASYQRFYFYKTDHAGCVSMASCPPITPLYGYFEPVGDEVATALMDEGLVAKIDNRNDAVFFTK
jgi:hypothetical protein